MFFHKHPYEPFLFEEATRLIVGTLPPPRFSTGDLKENDVNFCYGSRDGQLWQILDVLFNLDLKYVDTDFAIEQRKDFLKRNKIGICDIVESAERNKIDASDLGMQNIILRDIVSILKKYQNIETLLFTGGNSKNGPEYFFRKHLKDYQIELQLISNDVPRKHRFNLNIDSQIRIINTVSLTAPSGAANRAIGSMDVYKLMKKENPKLTTFDFRVLQYRPYFQ